MDEMHIDDNRVNEPATIEVEDFPIDQELHDRSSQPFVGRWNDLVSTTNWEKGRIILQWRDALIAEEAPATQYSDETWGRLVGGVTGQHVGRLRRVFQRFGEVFEKYETMFWSHFQAAIDWDDAEMWLEGAVQNQWSVSQMRRKRWETMGAPAELKPLASDVIATELDEDFEPANNQNPDEPVTGKYDEIHSGPRAEGPDFGDADEAPNQGSAAREMDADDEGGATAVADEPADLVRPFENLADLPTDLAEAFDSFKVAIIRHKAAEWEEIPRTDVLSALDALKELATAPTAE